MKEFIANKELYAYDICKKAFYTLEPGDILVGVKQDDFFVYYRFDDNVVILTIDEHNTLDELEYVR